MDPPTDRYAAPPPYKPSSNPNNNDDDKKYPSFDQNGPRMKLACLSLHMSDRIRLLNFYPEHTRIITDVVRTHAIKGVQDVRLYEEATEIKLAGYPWMRGAYRPLSEDRVGAIKLMIIMLKTLYELGWVVQFASDIWRKGGLDKDSLILRYTSTAPLPTTHWIGISFDSSDLVNIVNAPPILGPALAAHFGAKVNSHRLAYPGERREYYEIKFHGIPWWPSGTDAVKSRLLMLGLLEVLEMHGFRVCKAIDQGGADGGGSDTWFCCRDERRVEGGTVY